MRIHIIHITIIVGILKAAASLAEDSKIILWNWTISAAKRHKRTWEAPVPSILMGSVNLFQQFSTTLSSLSSILFFPSTPVQPTMPGQARVLLEIGLCMCACVWTSVFLKRWSLSCWHHISANKSAEQIFSSLSTAPFTLSLNQLPRCLPVSAAAMRNVLWTAKEEIQIARNTEKHEREEEPISACCNAVIPIYSRMCI